MVKESPAIVTIAAKALRTGKASATDIRKLAAEVMDGSARKNPTPKKK